MVPVQIYRGAEPGDREKARDTWQWYRFHDKPNEDQSAFDFFQEDAHFLAKLNLIRLVKFGMLEDALGLEAQLDDEIVAGLG